MAKLGIFDETIKDKRWFDITLYPQGWYDEEFADDAVGNTYPTVALNSPADAGAISDPTPQVLFTGTDSESEDLEYQIQIDTVNTFDSQFTSPTLNPSDKGANVALSNGDLTATRSGGSGMVRAQALAAISGTMKKYFELTLDTTGNQFFGVANSSAGLSNQVGFDANGWSMVVDDGGKWNNGNGGAYGHAFANGDVIGCAVDMVAGTITMYDENGVSLGVMYSGLTGTLYPAWGCEVLASVGTINLGATAFAHTPPAGHTGFFIPGGALLDKKSETDAGFLNIPSGGDTHPFTNNEQIGFTVQAGDTLADDTYYWRVRARDPNGSFAYGAWSTIRSFILTASSSSIYNKNIQIRQSINRASSY